VRRLRPVALGQVQPEQVLKHRLLARPGLVDGVGAARAIEQLRQADDVGDTSGFAP